MTWKYARTADFATVIELWESGRPALLTGPSGIGKTTLARQFAGHLCRRPLWVIGTPAMADTPLAALASAVPVDDADGVPDLVRRLRDRLARGALVVVEAAEHLDAVSSAIVAGLFASVARAGIITAGAAVDPGLSRALEAAGACEVRLSPFDLGATAALVEQRLGGPLAVPDALRIHRVAEGNPFYLTEYVDGAVRAGDLAPDSIGVWRLSDAPAVSDDLRRAGAERLSGASPSEIRLLDLLSLCAPLPRAVVDGLGLADGVGDVERELVLPLDDAVVPGHALFTEIRRAEIGALRRRRLAGELVDALGEIGGGPVERLHRARLCVEYGLPLDAGSLAGSAAAAFLLGDLPLAAELAALAVERGAGLPALLQLSRARSAMGDSAGAQSLLADVEPDSLDEAELAGYAITVAIDHTVGRGDHASAIGVLDKFEPRLSDAELRIAFTAVRAISHLNAGQQRRALECARTASGRTDECVWRAVGYWVEAEALRRLGETGRPLVLARAALDESRSAAALVGVGARRTRVLALLAEGDLRGARDAADHLLELVPLQHIPQAVASSTRATVAIAEGQFAAAVRYGEGALAVLGRNDSTGLGRGTALQLTGVYAVLGDVAGARRSVEYVSRTTTSSVGWAGFDLLMARAFLRSAEGEVRASVELARTAAAMAVGERQDAAALGALHWAVRMGDRRAARELAAADGRYEGALPAVQLRHARALLAPDAVGLMRVAEEFDALGAVPSAVDAYAQAVDRLRAAGHRAAVGSALRRLAGLEAKCSGRPVGGDPEATWDLSSGRRDSSSGWRVAGGCAARSSTGD